MIRPTVNLKACLEYAAELIEECGWCQRRMFDGPCSCILGAIDRATPDDESYRRAHGVVLRIISDRQPGVCVSAWNDDPLRTRADVISVLRAAASKAPKAA